MATNDGDVAATPWPPHDHELRAWHQHVRGGTREDRTLSSISATIPPLIADVDFHPPLDLVGVMERSLVAVSSADAAAAANSAALNRFLIRTESVASSKIERVSADAVAFAKAIAGNRSNTSATSMVAASNALTTLVSRVGDRGRFEHEDLLDAHAALMRDDPAEASYAGRVRDMQNWIGGSDHSPRDALHVPPAPERVADLVDDLIVYLNRDDVPVFVQAAIAHAQFESIHAFTDGNGRIGRALVSAVLRRRRVTKNSVVPLASALLARRDDYFATLGEYRAGDPTPIIRLFARAAEVAATQSQASITRVSELPQEWAAVVKPRAGAALEVLLSAFYDHPVMSISDIERASPASTVPTYAAIDRLETAGIIREITGRKRDRVWVASDLMAELDELDRRIQRSMS